MADLIDRDALLKKICGNECGSVCNEECENVMCNYYDYIMDAPAVNRWIPVEDALPEENARCLVYTESGGYGISRKIGRNLEKWNCFGLQVTHWMPLPEPPEKEQ